MCGRFVQDQSASELAEIFDATVTSEDVPACYNIAPTQSIWTVRQRSSGERELVRLHWGLIPAWSKEPKLTFSTINARAETVASKPTYRQAFRQRRCLIPASGFYEWVRKEGETPKQPYYIRFKDQTPMVFAGLWERWAREDHVLESCTIIITAANSLLQTIHDRMPVILHPDDYASWLDSEQHDPVLLQELLRSYPAETMMLHPVSKAVNTPRNNNADLVSPIA